MGNNYRRKCPDVVERNQELALNSTIYILRNLGPLGFCLKEEGEIKDFKVLIGNQHSCTCNAFQKERELCRHICWVILKRLRISKLDPLSYQLGFNDRDIDEMLTGSGRCVQEENKYLKGNKRERSSTPGKEINVVRKQLASDDVCPICQENLLEKHWPITYCRKGCGNNIHIRCMKIWSDHQIADGIADGPIKEIVKCPYCRGEFCTVAQLNIEYRNDPTRFTKYRSEINSLPLTHKKSVIIGENDEQWLTPCKKQMTNKIMDLVPIQIIPHGSRLLLSGYQCCLCLQPFQPKEAIGRLKCRHRFHKTCLTNWFLENKPVCPIDEIPVLTDNENKITSNKTLEKSESKSDVTFFVCGMQCGGETSASNQQKNPNLTQASKVDSFEAPKLVGIRGSNRIKDSHTKVSFKKVNLLNHYREMRCKDINQANFQLSGTKITKSEKDN